ncbi:MAG: carbohydrate binding family 9 domain-containing protein [Myxococcaceae bacterium]|nr:carbohydrate binding family 9 domain-containing protein [Myxococcaceae bacterium]
MDRSRTPGPRSRALLAVLVLGPWLLPAVSSAEEPSAAGASSVVEAAQESFQAVRTSRPPKLDGRLEEDAWARAPVFDTFARTFPDPSKPPSERTEVRVLYDDKNLYVGITCLDGAPASIIARLGRRDRIPSSDEVRVMVESTGDRRTGYLFAINAGGTQEDALITQDNQLTPEWDALWDGATVLDERGWTAELRLPLRIFRFPEADEQRWGLHVRRVLGRTREQFDSVLIPREDNALVSRFRELRGLRALRPKRQWTLTPYLATRLGSSPLASAPSGRILTPSLDVGVDLQAKLASDLSLAATLNPDYGQVEADELLVNLTTMEAYFPEKRPFFLDGLELFQPVGPASSAYSQSLFYSRRIGLDVPLLGAVKLTGTAAPGVQVGLLDAVVAGAVDPTRAQALEDGEDPDALPPDERYRFHPLRPLHLAPNHSLPAELAPPTNYLATVVRVEPTEGISVGATTALATPLTSRCTGPGRDEPDCEPRGGQAAALSTTLSSPSGDYVLQAQASASRVTGGLVDGALLLDGTRLRRGDTGFGAYVHGGKLGGEPWRLELTYAYASPRLELNTVGFQPLQNVQYARAHLKLVRTSSGVLQEGTLGLSGDARWSADGRGLSLARDVSLTGSAVFADNTTLECDVGFDWGRADLREVRESGVAVERPPFALLGCFLATDPSLPFAVEVSGYGDTFVGVPVAMKRSGLSLELNGIWRPQPRLETRLEVEYSSTTDGVRWLSTEEDGRLLFAELEAPFVSVTLRQLLVLTRSLTLQGYAQLLTGYGAYGPFYAGVLEPGETYLPTSRLTRTEALEDPSFRFSALNLSLVLRWEYALGSTLFFVYSRAQEEAPSPEGVAPELSLVPRSLLSGPRTDTVLLKVSHSW